MELRELTKEEKESLKRLVDWYKNKKPLFHMDGSPAEPLKEDEKFVLVYDYHKKDLDYRYLISQYGRVISAARKNLVEMKSTKDIKRTHGYWHVGSWLVHVLIWFSFASNSIRVSGGKDFPDFVGIVKPLTLADLAKLSSIDKKEIHHKDETTEHNELSNLECSQTTIHNMLKNHFSRLTGKEEYEGFRAIAEESRKVNPTLATIAIKNVDPEDGDYYAAYNVNPIEVYDWIRNNPTLTNFYRKNIYGDIFSKVVNCIEKDHVGYFDKKRVIHVLSNYLGIDNYYVLAPKKKQYLGKINYMCEVVESLDYLDFIVSDKMVDVECDLNRGVLNLVQE